MFEQVDFESHEEFFNAVYPLGHGRGNGWGLGWLYRGTTSMAHTLVPSALRASNIELMDRLVKVHGEQGEGTQRLREWNILLEFRKRLNMSGLRTPTGTPAVLSPADGVISDDEVIGGRWPPFDWLPLAALAQHSGLPTRLLDWSHSPYVATYFAASGALSAVKAGELLDDRISVWMLDIGRCLEVGTLELPPLSAVYPPYHENPNLRAQKGIFTVWREAADASSSIDRRPLNELIAADRWPSDSSPDPFLYRYTLPTKLGPILLLALERMGFTAASIFPSYEGAARAHLELEDAKAWGREVLD